MKLKNIVILVFVIFILIVGGLFIFESGITGKTINEEKLIKVGIITYPGFAPFYIAKEKGFFEKEGVNAEVVLIDDFRQAIPSLESNNVQILFSSADFTTIVADSGVDVREIFASDIGYGSDGLLVKDDVNSLSDLKGRTVYLSMGTPSHFLFRFLSEKEGLEKGNVKVIEMGADQVGAAFFAGQIDYGMSWEPWLSKASEREDGKLLFSSKDYPGVITDTFIVRADVLETRNEDVKAVVRAWFDSVKYIESNPDDSNEIMARNLGLPLEDFKAQVSTIRFLSYDENLAKFSRSSSFNIYELTEKAISIYRGDGIIQSDVNPDKIIDPTLLRSIYR